MMIQMYGMMASDRELGAVAPEAVVDLVMQPGVAQGQVVEQDQVVQVKDQEYVESCDDDADFQRDAEKQIEADGCADDLREVGGADGKLRQDP